MIPEESGVQELQEEFREFRRKSPLIRINSKRVS
jgi:hypothetical protein